MEVQLFTTGLNSSVVSSSTWYYTLSTSAQVLAALEGLFAVFVVYKIQSMQVIFDNTKIAFMKLIEAYSSIIKDYNRIEFVSMHFWSQDQILEKVKEINEIKNENPDRLKAIIPGTPHNGLYYDICNDGVVYYSNLINKRKDILKSLKSNSIIIFSAIVVCLVGLAVSDTFVSRDYGMFISIVLFFVVVSIIILARDIYKITKI